MSQKVLPHTGTPDSPHNTLVAKADCRVIRLKGPASDDAPLNTGIKDLLLAVQSETEALLEQLEQHHKNGTSI